jgi:MarR family transcriptional regulator, organic hydroperoxide resistance regulator
MLQRSTLSVRKPAAIGAKERADWPDSLKRELYSGEWNIGFVFRDLHRICRAKVQQAISAKGVAIGAWAYLWALYEEDGLMQNELARRVRLVGPSVVAAINQMERDGLVRRQRSTTDRRATHVFLTEKGWALRETIVQAACRNTELAFKYLTSVEINQLFELLGRVRIALEEEEAPSAGVDAEVPPAGQSREHLG